MPGYQDTARVSFLRSIASLAPRHRWVVERLLEGMHTDEIAQAHDPPLAKHTVEIYISEIIQATGCRDRTDLIGKLYRYVLAG